MRTLQTVGDLAAQADALRLDIVPVFRVVPDDRGEWMGEAALDSVQGLETAVLEVDMLRLRMTRDHNQHHSECKQVFYI
jgi:hypothetical protein